MIAGEAFQISFSHTIFDLGSLGMVLLDRLMSLWSLTLPLALYPLTGPEWTIPFSVVLSYVVLSIEDIGAEIEEPFQVLPLRQYTEGEFKHFGVLGSPSRCSHSMIIHTTHQMTLSTGTADSLDAIVEAFDAWPKSGDAK